MIWDWTGLRYCDKYFYACRDDYDYGTQERYQLCIVSYRWGKYSRSFFSYSE